MLFLASTWQLSCMELATAAQIKNSECSYKEVNYKQQEKMHVGQWN